MGGYGYGRGCAMFEFDNLLGAKYVNIDEGGQSF